MQKQRKTQINVELEKVNKRNKIERLMMYDTLLPELKDKRRGTK